MILYLDTSALVRLYVEERGTATMTAAVERASSVATARVTYTEARATFARLERAGAITRPERRRLARNLDDDWSAMTIVDISERLVHRAGDLAERHALRGYDAVQLAAALTIKAEGGEIEFSSFDLRLSQAAQRERLTTTTAAR